MEVRLLWLGDYQGWRWLNPARQDMWFSDTSSCHQQDQHSNGDLLHRLHWKFQRFQPWLGSRRRSRSRTIKRFRLLFFEYSYLYWENNMNRFTTILDYCLLSSIYIAFVSFKKLYRVFDSVSTKFSGHEASWLRKILTILYNFPVWMFWGAVLWKTGEIFQNESLRKRAVVFCQYLSFILSLKNGSVP